MILRSSLGGRRSPFNFCSAICGTVLCGTVLCGTVLCGTVLCGTVLCRAVLCRAVLCGAVLFFGAAFFGAEARGQRDADPSVGSESQSGPVSFHRDIQPLLQVHCLGCHQPAKPSGDYVMTSFSRMLSGGESGSQAIVPGDPDQSYLMDLITSADGEAEMPAGKPPLADASVAMFRRWIAQGAEDDSPPSARRAYDQQHPPVYTAPPVITSIASSPDGRWLAVAGFHEVLLHRQDGSGLAARLIGTAERIESVAFSPDGTKLAVAGGLPARQLPSRCAADSTTNNCWSPPPSRVESTSMSHAWSTSGVMPVSPSHHEELSPDGRTLPAR